jgi:hypothetical protein
LPPPLPLLLGAGGKGTGKGGEDGGCDDNGFSDAGGGGGETAVANVRWRPLANHGLRRDPEYTAVVRDDKERPVVAAAAAAMYRCSMV